MSVLEAAAAAAVHELAEQDPGPAPAQGRRPASADLPGRFRVFTDAAAVTQAGVDLPFSDFVTGAFGVTQLTLSTAADPRLQLVDLKLDFGGDRTLFRPVTAHALQRLFSRPLMGPVVVRQRETLVAHAQATAAGGEGRLRVGLAGLTGEQLDALAAAGRVGVDPAGRLVQPVLLARHIVVPAGATTFEVSFESRGVDLDLRRIAASTDSEAHDHDLGLTLRLSDGNALPELSPAQFDDVFRDRAASPPVRVDNSFPFAFYVDNPTGVDVPLSVVVEAYPSR